MRKIDVERWGIEEHGLLLSVQKGAVIELLVFGRCGSVFSETWVKASDGCIVEKDEEDKARTIEFRSNTSVKMGEIEVKLRLQKLTVGYPKS